MKAFRFRLERVLDLREMQLKAEESKLEKLFSRKSEVQEEVDALEASLMRAQPTLTPGHFVNTAELVAFELYKTRVARDRLELISKMVAIDEKIELQKRAVMDARSGVRLLERLREAKKEAWQTEANQEMEALAGDFSTAQWVRNHRG